jgi:drug/metabolite transporter (DMT)-like permease
MIVPYIIYKIRSKKDVHNDNHELNQMDTKFEYIYEENNIEDDIKYKERYILLIGIIFFINYIMFVKTFEMKTNTWIVYILFTSIFYYIIFKAKLFKHHYLSIIIILIIGLIIDLIQGNIQNDFTNNIVSLILSFIRVILLSFNYVIIKYTMEKKFVSLYEIGLFNGIINLILFIIFAIFDYFFFHIDNYEEYFNNFDGKEVLVIFGLMFTQFGIYLPLFIIDKNNSPCHIFIIFIFGQLAYYINLQENLVIVIICLIIILFFSLIFNEIIEINFCGLSHDTKKNIISRAQTEVDESIIIKTDTLDENNDNNKMEENSIELNNIINS